MVLISLKLIVLTKKANFSTLLFLFFLSNYCKTFLWTVLIFFVVIYNLFCLVSVLSDVVLNLLLSSVFENGPKVSDVIIVCCCCLILLFVLTRFLNIGISHQSRASFFTSMSYLLCRLSFPSYTIFLKKSFFGFSGFPKILFGFFFICSIFGIQLCRKRG